MSCEKYQGGLIDAAATPVDPAEAPDSAGILPASLNFGPQQANEIRTHLTTCAPCRIYLEQQQSLFAAIDSSIRSSVNEPLPGALVQRLQARAAQVSGLARNRYPMLATRAIAVAAAIVLGIITVQHHSRQARPQTGIQRTIAAAAANTGSAFTAPSARPSSRGRPSVVARSHAGGSQKQSELEVVVPSDQQRLLAEYARLLQERAIITRARPVPLPAAPAIEPIVIAANDIPELKVQPLPDLQSK